MNGWVFSGVSPPTVARRTWTLNSRPLVSVARAKSSPAWAASGMRMSVGSEPSARSWTAMPQPESWCSDWRMSGFGASSSSWRSDTGSAATQPKILHTGESLCP